MLQKEGSCLWKLKGDSKNLLRSNKHLLNQEKYHTALNSGIHTEVFARNDLDELNKGRLTTLGRLLADWRAHGWGWLRDGIRAREGTRQDSVFSQRAVWKEQKLWKVLKKSAWKDIVNHSEDLRLVIPTPKKGSLSSHLGPGQQRGYLLSTEHGIFWARSRAKLF